MCWMLNLIKTTEMTMRSLSCGETPLKSAFVNFIFERKSIGVQKVQGSFHCTWLEPTGCRILGEKRNQIFLPVQWGRFLSKDSVCALQPRLIISFPNLFFFVLIVWYSALLIHVLLVKVILLLLFCYLIQNFAFSSYLFLFFYFNFLTVPWTLGMILLVQYWCYDDG